MGKHWRGIVAAGALALALGVPCSGLAAAAAGPVAQYEAGKFHVSGGHAFYLRKTGNDPSFTSNGALLIMYGTYPAPQTASITVNTPAHVDKIIVPVRGEACPDATRTTFGRSPHFVVSIDGAEVISAFATSGRWQRTSASIDLPAGRHTFTVTFDNDLLKTGTCDRVLRIDHVALYDIRGAPGQAYPQTTWAPVGTKPLPDDQAASLITRRPETRPENAAANSYRPSDAELQAFLSSEDPNGATSAQLNPQLAYVTGRPGLSNPSTDDLIQWAAHKWGIPEDVIRAQMVTESSWSQSFLGDRATVPASWYDQYPPQARIPGTSDVYQSMGITQVKWTPDNSLHPGTEPLRWKSAAFNLDYYAATLRYYYDGLCDWCTSGYVPGQDWFSVGAWFEPQPWLNLAQLNDILNVRSALADRPWESPDF